MFKTQMCGLSVPCLLHFSDFQRSGWSSTTSTASAGSTTTATRLLVVVKDNEITITPTY
jgi:hypothetical protein